MVTLPGYEVCSTQNRCDKGTLHSPPPLTPFSSHGSQQWRHSSFGNYYVHDLGSHKTTPIAPPTYPAKIAYATWSPTGHSVAYVSSNDLYVVPDATYVTTLKKNTTARSQKLAL